MEAKNKRKYVDWLWRLLEFGVIEQQDLDREAGHLYEFPKCCVDNYVRLRGESRTPGHYMGNLYGQDDLSDIKKNPRVRCEKCRKSNNLGS
jgi:hypothetical protein